MNTQSDNIIYLLWTGGWDSTYRLVELSRKEVTVQPIYCCDPGRKSTRQETDAMNSILQALTEREETLARFMPIEYVDIRELPDNPEITNAYRELCKKIHLGTQYEWLAKLALKYPGIELGIEKPNGKFGGCTTLIKTFGRLKKENGTIVLDKENSTEECCLILGNFTFPILDTTDVDMVQNIAEWGYEDIMSKIWFCLNPLNGQPCGMCNPCQQKMKCKMDFLLPPRAHKRFRAVTKANALFGTFGTKAVKFLYRIILK